MAKSMFRMKIIALMSTYINVTVFFTSSRSGCVCSDSGGGGIKLKEAAEPLERSLTLQLHLIPILTLKVSSGRKSVEMPKMLSTACRAFFHQKCFVMLKMLHPGRQ